MNSKSGQPEGLIAVLLNRAAQFGDRDDAALDLGDDDEPAAEKALLRVVLDHTEDEDLADTAGESLSQIWSRKGTFDAGIVARMHPSAQKFFES